MYFLTYLLLDSVCNLLSEALAVAWLSKIIASVAQMVEHTSSGWQMVRHNNKKIFITTNAFKLWLLLTKNSENSDEVEYKSTMHSF